MMSSFGRSPRPARPVLACSSTVPDRLTTPNPDILNALCNDSRKNQHNGCGKPCVVSIHRAADLIVLGAAIESAANPLHSGGGAWTTLTNDFFVNLLEVRSGSHPLGLKACTRGATGRRTR